MIFLIADTHFSHSRIISHCSRPFKDAHHMDSVLLDNINNLVGQNDTLYHLGDFCFRGKPPEFYRERINCRNIHLILGNHDDHNIKYTGFTSVQHYKELRYNGRLIVLSHYPMRSWRNIGRGSIMLHGHCHHNLAPIGRSLDVGVDGKDYNYSPLNLDKIIERLEKIEIYAPDHHKTS
jgi:calcineurin-like phosphoesterase family protein